LIEVNLNNLWKELPPDVKLVAVSKYYPVEAIERAYKAGQRVFAESRPQDFAVKVEQLPKDIEWHFIGHLQTNKLKLVLPYASLVQSVDSRHLLDAIEKWGKDNDKVVQVLLEIHIGAEQTKQGFAEEEALDILFNADKFPHVRFRGLMAMATNTDDESIVDADFARIDSFMAYLVDLFPELEGFDQLSIGMSGDYKIALRHGATMVRIGSAIFAEQ
jgi:pyridoxal phosphate enzyme (YggS family)